MKFKFVRAERGNVSGEVVDVDLGSAATYSCILQHDPFQAQDVHTGLDVWAAYVCTFGQAWHSHHDLDQALLDLDRTLSC